MQTLYEAAGGEAGLIALAEAWHARCLADEVVAHAFHGHVEPDHCARLSAYWIEALGGPAAYSERYGSETDVVRMHSGNGPHDEMNARAIACFDAAMTDVGIADDARVRGVLHDWFSWSTPEVNRFERSADDVPLGLEIPRWTWDGLAPVDL